MPDLSISQDFALDAGVFSSTRLTLAASTDANALAAVAANETFPDGDIVLGHISFTADTGEISVKPAASGASISFEIAASAQSGAGVYGAVSDAIRALGLTDTPTFTIPDGIGQRHLLLDWGYTASFSGSASHPIGLLGSASFGVDARHASVFAILHRFDPRQGARDVLGDTISSWRLPRNVAFSDGNLNLAPATWLIAEADGSLGLKVDTSLGFNMSYVKDLKLLGVTHNLSAKIDASLTASLGFNVAGKYVLVVGREDAGSSVRVQLFKSSSKGLNFGFDLNVGVQGSDPQLPENFDDLIKGVFGVHGLQVSNDLRAWTDPSVDIGQKLAGLADQTALDLLKSTTGIDPAAEFDKAKQIVGDALNTWTGLPEKLSSMLWKFLDKQAGAPIADDFKNFLGGLADPASAAETLANALQQATFGDTPQGQFLESLADQGLLALARNLAPVSQAARQVLNILNGGILAKLQDFLNQKLNLDQIRNAVSDADFGKIEQWLQNRLGNFLDKTLGLDDLKDVQKAINSLDIKVSDFYQKAIVALTKRYSMDFAVTYQETSSGTALLDVSFDLSQGAAAALFAEVMASNLDNLLTQPTPGVTLHQAKLTHEIKRKGTVDLHMPLFDFSGVHLNDAIVSLTAEDQGGRVLLYQVDAQDKVTVANRAASQLSILASLKAGPGNVPRIEAGGSIAYEMLQVKKGMRPIDLEARTSAFIHNYLGDLFSAGDTSIRGFYADLDNRLTVATANQSNHLGDMAVSMQSTLDATLLGAWLQPRSAGQLRSDQMHLSIALQAAWKQALPSLYFQDLDQYQLNESIAALLVWSSLPVSTAVAFDGSTLQFNKPGDVFWDWPDIELRRAMARDPHTVANLAGTLDKIGERMLEAGNSNAGFFNKKMAARFVEMALNVTGDTLFSSLLFTEAQLVGAATDALAQATAGFATGASAPTQAIKTLAAFAASLTDTFNSRVSSVYAGMPGRVIGPMLLVESSAALGAAGAKPAAMLSLYALKPGHAFDLSTFVDGKVPQKTDVALTQTLVSLS